jgi:cyclopropane-fatty-acyl-phospholipid synthase
VSIRATSGRSRAVRQATSRSTDLMFTLLQGLAHGHLIISSESGQRQFGMAGSRPAVNLVVHDERFFRRVLLDSDLGLGESYMDGWWDVEGGDVSDLLDLVLTNRLNRRKPRPALAVRYAMQSLHDRPTRRRSRPNVHAHYDLGNDFFATFLDPTMTYSCGFEASTGDSLEQMQLHKYEITCRKLNLQPGDTVLDVGCGWGGFLAYAGTHYGIRGLGVTLSPPQAEWAQATLERLDLGGRITVRVQDYRQVTGAFDKVVSIGMFEHVGRTFQSTFMRTVRRLLKPGGLGLLHTMGTTGDRDTGGWLRTYIFPGTSLPRLEDLCQAMRSAGLTVGEIENWKPHYARTAHLWSANYSANHEQVRALGPQYDDRFLRMWHYYLQLVAAAFECGDLQLYRVLFAAGRTWQRPPAFDFTVLSAPDSNQLTSK